MSDDLWDDDDEGRVVITEEHMRESMARYDAPITKHVCAGSCKMVPGVHDIEDIFDDFQLSLRKREIQDMEIRRAKGREHKEKMLLRRFQSTLDGSFVLRMDTATEMTKQHIGDLHFDTQAELDEYYNYCIDVFGFSKALKIGVQEDENLFDDLFDEGLDDLFDIDDDDPDDLFGPDEDEDDEGLWD